MDLKNEHEDYLSILEQGQCLVRVNSIKRPFLLWVPHIKRNYLTASEIDHNNKLILQKIRKKKSENTNKFEEVKTIETIKNQKIEIQNVVSINNSINGARRKLEDYLNELAQIQKNLSNEDKKLKEEYETLERDHYDNEIHLHYCSHCNSFHTKSKTCKDE